MINLRGRDHEELCDALIDAYSDWGRLETLVRIELNERLEHKVSRNLGLEDVASQLIDWANAAGKLPQLIEAAHRRTPGNEKLSAFYVRWQARRAVDAIAPPTSRRSAPPRHLLCDRDAAWTVLETVAQADGEHVIFVCGKRGDGHARFAERVKAFAAEACNAVVRPLSARIFELPIDSCSAKHVLCEALKTHADDVERALASWLEERSVILLYPTVETSEQATWLRRHNAEHLSALITALQSAGGREAAASGPRRGLVAVQPIRWKPSLLDFIPWISGHARTHRKLGTVLDQSAAQVIMGAAPVSVWQEHLGPITQADLAAFFTRIYARDPKARARAVARAQSQAGRSPEEIFDWLVEELQ